MGFSGLETVLLFFILPLSWSVKLVQVVNLNTICLQNEVIYECIVDDFLQWDVRHTSSSTNIFTYSYTQRSGTDSYTKRIGSSTISAQLIFRNSTILSSVLTITNVTSLGDQIITCNGEVENLLDSLVYTYNTDNSHLYGNISEIYLTWREDFLTILWDSNLIQNSFNIVIASNHSIILNETVFQPAITFNNTHDVAFLSVNITPVCAERAYEFIIGYCLRKDSSEIQNRIFSLTYGGIWTIHQNCSTSSIQYQTTCTATGWSTDIKCTALNTTLSYITLISSGLIDDVYYFLMTWEMVDIIADSYSVMITPTPADGCSERKTQLPATTLGLYENVEYKVTISPGTYSIGLNKTFTIGYCGFISNTSSINSLQYRVKQSGITAALVRCYLNNTFEYNETVECGHDNDNKRWISTPCTRSITYNKNIYDASTSVIKNIDKNSTISLLEIILSAVILFAFIIGISLGCSIGTLFGKRIAMKYIHKQSDEQQNMNCPVYETVELNEQTQNVSMSCNIAYGNFTQ